MDNPDGEFVIAHADKTVLKISGLKVKALNARNLETTLSARLQSTVRVIGVTGNSIDMDVYGMDAENILKDEEGLLRAVSLCEGITAADLAKASCSPKTVSVGYEEIPHLRNGYAKCAKEKWLNL
ncbi:MAG: hypothetical protein FWG66_07325 [Spirochaetes bacterium]|nr:hypothetical protein [Spirochaetota bacterium]